MIGRESKKTYFKSQLKKPATFKRRSVCDAKRGNESQAGLLYKIPYRMHTQTWFMIYGGGGIIHTLSNEKGECAKSKNDGLKG